MQAARTDIRGHSNFERELGAGWGWVGEEGCSTPRWWVGGFGGWKKVRRLWVVSAGKEPSAS